jgi:hypothetical protein
MSIVNPTSFLPGFRMFKGEDLSALPTALVNVFKQISAAGINPASTAADVVLAVFALPANIFSTANNELYIQAQGSLVNNANNKTVKLIFNATTAVVGSAVSGGTTIASTGTVTTIGGGWSIQASVLKYGANGSNTQLALHEQAQVGATVSTLLAPSTLTAVENAPILVAVTGNAGTTATDITFNYLEIDGSN